MTGPAVVDAAGLARLVDRLTGDSAGRDPTALAGLAVRPPVPSPAGPALPAGLSGLDLPVPTILPRHPPVSLHSIPGLAPIAGLAPIPGLPGTGLPSESELQALLSRTSVPARPQAAALAQAESLARGFGNEPAPLAIAQPSATAPFRQATGAVPFTSFPAERLRREFPILSEQVHGKRLVWLDNAATTQKPQTVIDRISRFYRTENSNIHRAAHTLAARATDAYEAARASVQRFIHAASSDEIIFVRGATEGINLIAQSWGRANLGPGDEVLVSHLEHHANIVPWQQVTAATGAKLTVIPVDDRGALDLDAFRRLLHRRVKLVSVTQVANAIGTVVPVQTVAELAHAAGALVLIDGAQSVSHMPVDVQRLGADFFVFSGHKVYGPTGIGAVYGRAELLDRLPPWQGGGNMIKDVTFEHTEYHGAPARFEAGTGNIADAVGLGAALDWLSAIGLEQVGAYEHQLIAYAEPRLAAIRGLHILGHPPERAGVLSFTLDGYETAEVGQALDRDGIAVRSGHHCAQPILRRLGVEASVRASFGVYNTCADIDALIATVSRLAAQRR